MERQPQEVQEPADKAMLVDKVLRTMLLIVHQVGVADHLPLVLLA
jgi:hypothetical protein